MKTKMATLILLGTLIISTNNAHAFFGMMMNMMKMPMQMMQMPMQMMQGMNPMGQGQGGEGGGGEGGMFGVMNNMVNGMTDGMKLGFQGIDCFGDKIGLMSNRITQFAGRGNGNQGPGYGTGCDFNRIPLATGRSRQYADGRAQGEDYQTKGEYETGDNGQDNQPHNPTRPAPPLERKRARTSLDSTNEIGQPRQKRARLALDVNFRSRFAPQVVLLTKPFTGEEFTMKKAPKLQTNNQATQMYVHLLLPEVINLAGDKIEQSHDKIAHLYLFDVKNNWDNVWQQSLRYLAEKNVLASDTVILSVTTFNKRRLQGQYPDTNYVPVTVEGLMDYSQKYHDQLVTQADAE